MCLAGYCAHQLTEGVVPASIAAMIAGDVDPNTGASGNVARLEQVGRITRDENGTVRLPFFLDSNPSRAQVQADREAARRRQAEWREKRRRQGAG